jgi:hypothetical protein
MAALLFGKHFLFYQMILPSNDGQPNQIAGFDPEYGPS